MKTRDSSYYPTIMIVDEDIINNNLILDLLDNEDYFIQTAVDFQEVLEGLKKFIPDIMILNEKIIINFNINIYSYGIFIK